MLCCAGQLRAVHAGGGAGSGLRGCSSWTGSFRTFLAVGRRSAAAAGEFSELLSRPADRGAHPRWAAPSAGGRGRWSRCRGRWPGRFRPAATVVTTDAIRGDDGCGGVLRRRDSLPAAAGVPPGPAEGRSRGGTPPQYKDHACTKARPSPHLHQPAPQGVESGTDCRKWDTPYVRTYAAAEMKVPRTPADRRRPAVA